MNCQECGNPCASVETCPHCRKQCCPECMQFECSEKSDGTAIDGREDSVPKGISPLPWVLNDNGYSALTIWSGNTPEGSLPTGTLVAQVVGDSPEAEANAKFIVEAVNAYGSVPTAAGEGGSNPAGARPVEDSAADAGLGSERVGGDGRLSDRAEWLIWNALGDAFAVGHLSQHCPTLTLGDSESVRQLAESSAAAWCDPEIAAMCEKWSAHEKAGSPPIPAKAPNVDPPGATTGEALNPSQNERVKELEEALRDAGAFVYATSMNQADNYRFNDDRKLKALMARIDAALNQGEKP